MVYLILIVFYVIIYNKCRGATSPILGITAAGSKITKWKIQNVHRDHSRGIAAVLVRLFRRHLFFSSFADFPPQSFPVFLRRDEGSILLENLFSHTGTVYLSLFLSRSDSL